MDIKELYQLYLQHPCITTDSRDCPEGSIFLALKGESFDGNKFAEAALEKGCAYAIVDDPEIAKEQQSGDHSGQFILVDDCLQTFKDLAREHRRQFDIPVIGITGTNGKTTTKELIAAVLSQKYNVLYTQGNFNNDVGVPKTLFRLTKEHEIAVIEMGASHPGDIKTLAETAEPTCGLITNVGRAHLQGFGSFEGVIKTKCELYDFLRTQEDALIFLNADNEYLIDQIGEDEDIWISPYSTDPENQYTCISGEITANDPFLKFRWREPLMTLEEEGRSTKWHKVQTQLVGSYNIDNLLAAIAVGINFGVDRKKICAALEDYVPSNNRSQMTVTKNNRLIVDAYNANPSSMTAALENFQMIQADHKMVILGDMRELGDASVEEHQHVIDYLKKMDLEDVWLVGDEFAKTNCDFRKFHDVEEVKTAITSQSPEGKTILIKGSNGTKLFQLPELL
ncbi:UDP-N-acetylmuramoyl-tripeptide--D-alanyl-D-alanine ligase [Prevotella sp. lc2012]|uniref:UDP-N-acetylmuramoyl-tripeptide--D-alanyl-D- alanine ligase n=1 Tax=Prevotella sp. lc2012 TaxID=1761886 RepID=UPI0008956A46|nr:UDP-N-acetylmuramoyl-tripeptide--D-alanyl-D-alanine ligase [Prevotella sp. lc2012]SEE56513.1 UDP-N-acetylmuramoyl-tripeptide--D-alanyl-D-alanine ligase [Prevotella sp. lc2012]